MESRGIILPLSHAPCSTSCCGNSFTLVIARQCSWLCIQVRLSMSLILNRVLTVPLFLVDRPCLLNRIFIVCALFRSPAVFVLNSCFLS